MAEGVKVSLEMIVGRQEHVHTVSLRPDSDNLQFEKELNEKMKALNGTTLIIADLLGGTPCNVATKNYLNVDGVEIIAGMTLSVVIEAVVNQQASIKELVCLAQENIVDVKAGMNQAEQEISESSKEKELSNYSQYAGKENIVNTRIDERLIHGQVAGIWSTSLSTQRIIVANDEAATDPLQKSSLRMAAPSSMRLSVLGVEAAAKNIQSGKYGKQRLFLLFKNPKDVLRFIEAQGPIKTVNVGNMSYKEGAREVTKSIQVLPEEEQIFETIASKGVTVTAQLVPNDPVVDFMKKLRG
ncbi:PTS mannose/fructose/sorbose transporter subunit IIAB [Enterococcus faecalis]|uniref:PTS system, mannose/fructose/sorbose family, IIB component n=1 Tax=Enterococcus faecalis RP2S-4 TaxID=1244145 RepID=A0ABC9TLT7_ENTFL|nr:PTS mannose/fructose/sorbose transporter subunit IIAB [Enterococcus faecalis]EFQ69813.1 PTS system, mannose/fructose/sorbose family, IIB component [Enterococcus faecalis TX0470]EFU14866.1 PTS system, mannose/fructose/sorbose family, IIB component [Enterococcus faecalis TX1342]EPI06658.1 PTS system, mannose/fructose/sorbose family, IIB component [Enterococcus faecalis RP2S-4]MCM6934810.1 PTS mannose/fructose/sorbose transporter subunit IIAB [Enterococcus faecalis]MCO5444869.1 PTS mannose/fru